MTLKEFLTESVSSGRGNANRYLEAKPGMSLADWTEMLGKLGYSKGASTIPLDRPNEKEYNICKWNDGTTCLTFGIIDNNLRHFYRLTFDRADMMVVEYEIARLDRSHMAKPFTIYNNTAQHLCLLDINAFIRDLRKK